MCDLAQRWRAGWLTFGLLLLAVLGHAGEVNPRLVLTNDYDPDTINCFRRFDEQPALDLVLEWWYSDGPCAAHTFRPIAYLTTRLEYALFGRTVWPYQLVNLVYLFGCAALLVSLGVSLGLPLAIARAGGMLFLAWPTPATRVVVHLICTRSEVLCGLFSLAALRCLLGYLDHGGRRWLAGFGGCYLLAYLNKEMALGLAPVFIICACWWPAEPTRKRRVAAVILGVSLLWLIWFKLAELQMTRPVEAIPPGHTFANLWQRTTNNLAPTILNQLFHLWFPLGSLAFLVLAEHTWGLFLSGIFYQFTALLLLESVGLLALARRWPKLAAVLICWKLFANLPVAPLHDAFPWYAFLPHLLDRVGIVAGLWALVDVARQWREGRVAPRSNSQPGDD